MREREVPVATYRVQLRPGLGFKEARALVPYLRDLGVSHVYASPVFAARSGSAHGYDVVDPTRLNPELGTAADFRALTGELQRHGLGLLLDIVPNHMSASEENTWWADVLVWGEASRYARYFDVDWAEGGRRIVDWRSGRKPNYRRFFAIDDLVGVRVEDSEVFDATHDLTLRLLRDGMADALRVDHVDGLYDPLAYLRRLRSEAGKGCYIVVEKIVSGHERLPGDWPVQGTPGYDFLNALNGVFVEPRGLDALDGAYRRFAGRNAGFADVVYERKRAAAAEQFPQDFARLARRLDELAVRAGGPLLKQALWRQALIEVSACLPVYRTYIRSSRVSDDDRRRIGHALREARRRAPSLDRSALRFLQRVLLLDAPRGRKGGWLDVVMRWQQITGGAMAKGLEDSALYRYGPLASMNEVDADPRGPRAVSIAAFHRWNGERSRSWPDTMNATSTHDTKRSEDVRGRINVLSEMSDEWSRAVRRWHRGNAQLRTGDAPCANEEWLLYQTLAGAWPLGDGEETSFRDRVRSYMIKAARESGERTSWLAPDGRYEGALSAFIDRLLKDERFVAEFGLWRERVAWYGMINSLSQVVLKAASPGLPDLYQGTELWDFSLVDPDNRRHVDFAARAALLEGLRREPNGGAPAMHDLLTNWRDGRLKLYITTQALATRSENAVLFARGEYVPLYASNWSRRHIVAFVRRRGRRWAIVAATRFTTDLAPVGEWPLGEQTWKSAALRLPKGAPVRWRNGLTGEEIEAIVSASGNAVRLSDVLRDLPVAILVT